MITTLADIDPKRVAAILYRSKQNAYGLLADLGQESHAARRACRGLRPANQKSATA
ncbi:hypothetical protein [Bradyrhizobium neotropicale]|uniref:hypothetical protein n=1 Tax=Bradyrhizobium neotropicale TaxID=1497615 RepID=UPI001AD73175|nr:hypothetical protein [Bradyrhizobium neotropicale]MBO4228533.1 hypothetical protein [Bradyrhizobium neotropicale]